MGGGPSLRVVTPAAFTIACRRVTVCLQTQPANLDQEELLSCSFLSSNLLDPLFLLVLHFVSPKSVLVELGEAVHHNWDGQGENEDPGKGAEPADQFAWIQGTGRVAELPSKVLGFRS